MPRLALLFLVIALIAGAMNFSGIEAGALAVAQILFFVFLVLFVLALLVGVVRGKPTDVV